jgi:hypothetical protein
MVHENIMTSRGARDPAFVVQRIRSLVTDERAGAPILMIWKLRPRIEVLAPPKIQLSTEGIRENVACILRVYERATGAVPWVSIVRIRRLGATP